MKSDQGARSSHALLISLAVLAVAMLALPSARAQSTGGRIRGTVTDPSGGAVSSATVQLINEATRATRQVLTGENGDYSFIEVPVGSYEIDVNQQGFKKYVHKGIVLDLNQVLNVDIPRSLARPRRASKSPELLPSLTPPPRNSAPSCRIVPSASSRSIPAIPTNSSSCSRACSRSSAPIFSTAATIRVAFP